MIKQALLICIAVGVIAITVVAVSILSQIAIDHTTRYIESYHGIISVEKFVEAERYASRLLGVTEEAIRRNHELERELEDCKALTKDLYSRLNNKENSIADYCQATQDLSRTNEILARKIRDVSLLVYDLIKKLPEENREEARKQFVEIMSRGGKIQ